MPPFPPRYDVLGTAISRTTFDEVLSLLETPRDDRASVVAVCNVHSVMTARRDPTVAAALADADVATPDGMPLVWALNLAGHHQPERVYGPELMRRALEERHGLRHFLYGSTAEVLARLRRRVEKNNPDVQIVGTHSPPFGPIDQTMLDDATDRILRSEADVVWVGLGMPKQERWMIQMRDRLPRVTLLGVGAAFDFLAGTKPQAPRWMQQAGLEWLFRLATEPRRLWRRYLWNNPAFLGLLAIQVLKSRISR